MVFNLVNIYYGSIALDDMFSCQRLLCYAVLQSCLISYLFWIVFLYVPTDFFSLENILICFCIDEKSNISYLYNLHL